MLPIPFPLASEWCLENGRTHRSKNAIPIHPLVLAFSDIYKELSSDQNKSSSHALAGGKCDLADADSVHAVLYVIGRVVNGGIVENCPSLVHARSCIAATAASTWSFANTASDASKWASGAVLQQRDTNGDLHPCAYLSKSFSETERNYEIYDRELLGIVRALEEWQHYLEGSGHPVTILTDHKNLSYFKQPQKLNRRQARWALFLSQFDLQLVHTPGRNMVQSDALSRRPDLCPETDHDNEDRILLPDNLFVHLIDTELTTRFKVFAAKDAFFNTAHEAITNGTLPPMKTQLSDWEARDGLIFYKNRCYVPADEQL